MTQAVRISVVIPNLHSPIVDQTIESVLSQQTDLLFEVIVVGMDQWGLVEKYPEVRFIKTPTPVGAAEARNIGIQAAQGEWLFFIDSDCIAQPGWMETLAQAFREGWQVVGGGVQTPKSPFIRLAYNLSMFHAQLASQPKKTVPFLPTLNLAVQRDVIVAVGLLDEKLLRGQDVDWTARMTQAGFQLLFEPRAAILHLPPRQDAKTLKAYFYKSGYYMIQVRHRYPEIFHMPGVVNRGMTLRIFAPVIALLTTLKIVLKTKEVRQHIRTVPLIYKMKVAWCQGAAEALQSMGVRSK